MKQGSTTKVHFRGKGRRILILIRDFYQREFSLVNGNSLIPFL